MDRKFTYKIENVADEKSLVDGVKKKSGVKDCYVDNGDLVYVLDEHADEYEVLVEANELCAKYGGELIIGEEDDVESADKVDENESADYSADYNFIKAADHPEADDEEQIKIDQSKKRNIFAEEEDDYNEVDKIVSKKKKFRQETWFKLGELAVATILFIVCMLLPGDGTQFGFKTILSVLAFAIGGYEIFYAAITDLIRKKFISENVVMTIAAVMGALLGFVVETTALVVAFAFAKAVQSIADGVAEGKIDEIFYTGSVEITLIGGGHKRIEEIAEGDVLDLKELDVIPCDGEAVTGATLDTYRVLENAETKVQTGDKVYAGSVVLTKGMKVKVEKTNEQSKLTLERAAFLKKTEAAVNAPKAMIYANTLCLLLAVAATFLMPLIVPAGEYVDGMRLWGARAIAFIAVSMIIYAWYLANACVKNAMIAARYVNIDFTSGAALEKLGNANSFVFTSSTLTEDGKIKEDVYGCMNELLATGVKNVATEYDNELDEDVKAKLKFKQKAVGGEKRYVVGKDMTLGRGGDGDVKIIGKELSFVPLAYRTARRAVSRKKLSLIIKCVATVFIIVGMILIPAATLPAVYFGAISGAITALTALFALLSVKKIY